MKVKNVEVGVKFRDADFGICTVMRYDHTDPKSRSDIWVIEHEDRSTSNMTDWAICSREEIR